MGNVKNDKIKNVMDVHLKHHWIIVRNYDNDVTNDNGHFLIWHYVDNDGLIYVVNVILYDRLSETTINVVDDEIH